MRVILVLVAGHAILVALSMIFLRKSFKGFKFKDRELYPYVVPFILFYLFLIFHVIMVEVDSFVTSFFNLDFTHVIYAIEGSFVSIFQGWSNLVLDYYFVFIYIFGYSFLIYFTPAYYFFSRDLSALWLTVITYATITLLVLPFFLFFPVNDTWWASQNYGWYQGDVIIFQLKAIWPDIVNPFFTFTTINNCFPSLHCGISTIVAVIAWMRHHRRYALMSTVFAVSIPFATLYLGIHWLTDIVFGELFAAVTLIVGLYLTKKILGKKKIVQDTSIQR